MTRKRICGCLVAISMLIPVRAASAAVLGTAFTYQGRLEEGGSAVNATVDLQFKLYDALAGGTQIGTTQTSLSVTVDKGLFTVQIDFGGSAFTGEARWLELAVRKPAGVGVYTTLAPRQPVTATPYALFALAGGSGDITAVFTTAGLFGGGTFGDVTVGIADGGVTPVKIALPYSGTDADPAALWMLTNTGVGPAFQGASAIGDCAVFESTAGKSVVAKITAGANASDALGATTAGTGSAVNALISNPANAAPTILSKTLGTGNAIRATITNAANVAPSIVTTTVGTGNALMASIMNPASGSPSVFGTTTGTGPGGSFMNANGMAGATQDGIYSTTVASTVAASGVHAVGSGPGGPASAAALNIDSGAIDVSGPIPTRAVQCVPVGGGWIPISTCPFACPTCTHAHTEGYYTDVPFASPLIMVGGCNAPMDTMIIPSIETLGGPPAQRTSYYIQVHSRVPGGCVFRVTRMGDPNGTCPLPSEINRINVLMVNSL